MTLTATLEKGIFYETATGKLWPFVIARRKDLEDSYRKIGEEGKKERLSKMHRTLCDDIMCPREAFFVEGDLIAISDLAYRALCDVTGDYIRHFSWDYAKWRNFLDNQEALKIEEEEKKEPEMKTKLNLKNAALAGAELAAANEGGEIALEILTKLVPELEHKFDDPTARALGKAVAAYAITFLADAAAFEKADTVRNVAEKVITVSAFEISQQNLRKIRPLLMRFAKIGDRILPRKEES